MSLPRWARCQGTDERQVVLLPRRLGLQAQLQSISGGLTSPVARTSTKAWLDCLADDAARPVVEPAEANSRDRRWPYVDADVLTSPAADVAEPEVQSWL